MLVHRSTLGVADGTTRSNENVGCHRNLRERQKGWSDLCRGNSPGHGRAGIEGGENLTESEACRSALFDGSCRRSQFRPNVSIRCPKLPLRILKTCLSAVGKAGGRSIRTTELLERNHRVVKLLILIHQHLLFFTLSDDNAGITPAEFVHAPEGIDWEEEAVYRVSNANVLAKTIEVDSKRVRK